MTKEKLVEMVHNETQGSKKAAKDLVEKIFSSIADSLKKGEEVAISGFGTFRVSKRAARTGVNPRTGAKLQIPAMKVPKFKAGKALKEAVK